MKKKYVLVLLIVVFGLGISVDKFLFSNKEVVDKEVDVPKTVHEHMLSMMLETDSGSGEYSLEERSSWPTKEDGYVFNSTLSKCEKGSKLSWDEENSLVLMEGTTSDKCYVYFDIYSPPVTLADWVKSQYTIQGANNLYYHDSTLENGANDNSYRYAGSSDTTNNFVCFGSDEAICPDDNLYRMIGVFGDRVKLIKWDYANSDLLGTDGDYYSGGMYLASDYSSYTGSKETINRYYWKQDGTNTWTTSKLNAVNLNINFLNNIGATWVSKIMETMWIVGGNTDANIRTATALNAYKNEYTNPAKNTTYDAKIGLMYVSDYGFVAAPSAWTAKLSTYNSSAIKTGNWMYMGLNEWTIVRQSDDTDYSFDLYSAGRISAGNVNHDRAVRPVFYLNSLVNYLSGSGTKSDPIRLS